MRCGRPDSTGMRHPTAHKSAMTVIMHVAPPLISAAEYDQIRPRDHYIAAVTSAHVPHASRQGR